MKTMIWRLKNETLTAKWNHLIERSKIKYRQQQFWVFLKASNEDETSKATTFESKPWNGNPQMKEGNINQNETSKMTTLNGKL